jgi:DNA-binding GntR family transcriptional regulator
MKAQNLLNEELPNKQLRQKYQRLSELVVEQLINWIMDGTLQANQRLNADELAVKLGVSRMPVREALKVLEKSGLVQSAPYLGTKVTQLTKEDIEEIYILRQNLESTAAYYAALAIQPEEIAMLEKIQQRMLELISRDSTTDYKEVFQLNREFHHILYQASRMPRLCAFISTLWDNIAFYRLISASNQNYGPKMRNEHQSYIDALKKRDAVLIRRLFQESLGKHAQGLSEELERYYQSINQGSTSN